MTHRSLSRQMLCIWACFLVTGCVETRQPQIDVRGKIHFADGKPLPPGTTVMLNPTEGGVGTASGKTEADGTFTLTHVSGSGGPEAGRYTVKLVAPEGNRDFYRTIPSDVVNGDVLVAEVREGMAPLELRVPGPAKGRNRR